MRTNEYEQPIGLAVDGWTPRPRPARVTVAGRHCTLEPLDAARHAAELHAAYALAPDGRDWTYMTVGPFADAADYLAYATRAQASDDPLHFVVRDAASGRAVGTLALLRIDPANGVIEVGSVSFAPPLQRTRASTEAHFLLMRHAFETLGYRRYEWKCDSLNAPSRQSALRLGFSFEGIFRQALVYKGRNRDTAWYAIVDHEWPARRAAFEQWLADANFDDQGRQRRSLAEIRAGLGG
jgi:RimJ/RimL family protein N-acetyltransferase